LLNASVGVRRVVSRLRPTEARRSPAAHRIQRRSLALASAARAPRLLTRPHLAGERIVTVTAVGLVALAIALSNLGTVAAGGPTGNTSGAGEKDERKVVTTMQAQML